MIDKIGDLTTIMTLVNGWPLASARYEVNYAMFLLERVDIFYLQRVNECYMDLLNHDSVTFYKVLQILMPTRIYLNRTFFLQSLLEKLLRHWLLYSYGKTPGILH